MKKTPNSGGKVSPLNRRSVLRALGSVTVPFAIGTASAREESSKPEEIVIRRQGNWKSPLNKGRIVQETKNAVRHHVQHGGNSPGSQSVGIPGIPDEGKLVDYIVGVKQNGTLTQHVGVALSSDSVVSAHQKGSERFSQIQQSVTTESVGSLGRNDWYQMSDGTYTVNGCPKGQLDHNYTHWKLDESYEDHGEDVHQIEQKIALHPSSNENTCGEPGDIDDVWTGSKLEAEHRHNNSEFDLSTYNSKPDTQNSNGTIGVSIGYPPAASLSYSFNLDGDIYKSKNGDNIFWESDFSSNYSQSLEPTSIFITKDDSGGQKDLTQLWAQSELENLSPTTDTWYLWSYWNLWYNDYLVD